MLEFHVLGIVLKLFENNPANICMFKVDNINTGKSWEICSKLTIKPLERDLALTYFTSFSNFSILDFEQVNVNWEDLKTCFSHIAHYMCIARGSKLLRM